jgi:hypothetical protein
MRLHWFAWVRFVRFWERRCPILGADLEATPSAPGRNCLTLTGRRAKDSGTVCACSSEPRIFPKQRRLSDTTPSWTARRDTCLRRPSGPVEFEGCTDVADKVRYRFTWIMMHLCPRMISANVTGRYAMATLATTPTVERMNPPAITPAEPPSSMV